MTKLWIISLIFYEAPASLQEGNSLILVSSFCSEAICSSFVSSASSPGNFQRQLEISCTNDNQQQPTTNNQPQTSQPTNQQNQSCEPTSWVDAVVLASDNATSSWFDVQMPEDIRKNDQRPPVVLFAPSSVSPSHPCRQPGKYVQSFQQTLFWASYSRSKSHCENSPNQSSLLRQVEVFFLMILPAPQVFSSKSQIVFL